MQKNHFPIILSLLILILTSCGNPTQETPTATVIRPSENLTETPPDSAINNSSDQTDSYPPATTPLSDGYPSQETVFPYPAPPVYDESKRFTINEPLKPGDTTVTGIGPANVPIKVVSISDVGQPLGSGVIDDDGNFNINISPPLQSNYVVGILLSDDSMRSEFLDGPGYSDIPMIGLVLMMSVVESE